jgi:hypothetical protein
VGKSQSSSTGDVGAVWRNIPGFLYLNGDVVEEVRQLSGAGGKGTVDELGFQTLYDRIAERLFPWCSTLTSRARYFFLSLAVLDISLREAIDESHVDPNRDFGDLAHVAEQRRGPLMRTVKRIERALALSLVAKHGTEERGIFGSLRCRRWFRDDAEVSGRGKILSADARYPNAIYRGSCRALGMFVSKDSSTTGLLRARLSGVRIFDLDWHTHSRLALAAIQQLDEFWREAADRDLTFSKARVEIVKLSAFKTFPGFALRTDEARFLYSRIQQATPYLAEISSTQLTELVEAGDLDLRKLKASVSDLASHELFDAGFHIDAATAPFRALYQQCSQNRAAAEQSRIEPRKIRKSMEWLDTKSKSTNLEWASIWQGGISALIKDWLTQVNPDNTPGTLLDALCERAEQVVRGRGQGKQAPHQKTVDKEDDQDLRAELDVRETSFRLGNGTLILKDIAASVGDT